MAVEVCEICYENEPTFECSKCGCMLCGKCMYDWYVKQTNTDDVFRCINCDAEIPFSAIGKAMNCDIQLLNGLIENISKNKIKQMLINSYELERCVNAIKLRTKFIESEKRVLQQINENEVLLDQFLNIKDVIEYKQIVGKYPKDTYEDIKTMAEAMSNRDVYDTHWWVPGIKGEDNIYRKQFDFYILKKLNLSEPEEFIFQCDNPDCKNGLVNKDCLCVLCGNEYCKFCWKNLTMERKKGINHMCDHNDIESVNKLQSFTKLCPNCKCRTRKVSGCAHVFCNNCHCSFNWNTNKTTERYSNPDYNDWLETQPTNNHNNREPIGRFIVPLVDVANIDFENVNYNELIENLGQVCDTTPLFKYIYSLGYIEGQLSTCCYTLNRWKSDYEAAQKRMFKSRARYILNELDDVDLLRQAIYLTTIGIKYKEIKRIYQTFFIKGMQLLHKCIDEHMQIIGTLNETSLRKLNKFFENRSRYGFMNSSRSKELWNTIKFAIDTWFELSKKELQKLGINDIMDAFKRNDLYINVESTGVSYKVADLKTRIFKIWLQLMAIDNIVQDFNNECIIEGRSKNIGLMQFIKRLDDLDKPLNEYYELISETRKEIREYCKVFGIPTIWIPTKMEDDDAYDPFKE